MNLDDLTDIDDEFDILDALEDLFEYLSVDEGNKFQFKKDFEAYEK